MDPNRSHDDFRNTVKLKAVKAVEDKKKRQVPPADLFEIKPAEKPSTAGEITAWAELGRQAAMAWAKKVVLNSQQDMLNDVASAFRRLSGGMGSPSAIKAFGEWRTGDGWRAWDLFTTLQQPLAEESRKIVDEQERQAAFNSNKQRATALAVSLRDQYPHGDSKKVGRVVAGLADSDGGGWTGTSRGVKKKLIAVTWQLLSDVVKKEDWEVHACGEVDAINKYLIDMGFQSVKDIPGGELFSHAETWSDEKHRWEGRKACKNCIQWLERIGANLA
ncbi:hypothetical protein [Lentzea sp. NPDC059081]|uniref:hypothetical protein n=1 Tax=Lentzea sp. NPDC059081 TaxID=3346719 RepID=UPI0036A0D990